MKSLSSCSQYLAWIAVCMMCLPAHLAIGDTYVRPETTNADGPDRLAVSVSDVSLAAHGRLVGQVLDVHRRPEADAEVAIHADGQTVAVARTDANGMFAVAGLRGGVHHVSTTDVVQTYRFWAPGTAPPGAAPEIELVADPEIVRGQWGPPPMANNFVSRAKVWATNPFVVGGIVAAAVAIPVAIHNIRSDDRPAS